MALNREEILARRATIVKGMRLTLDCPHTTPFRAAPETPLAEVGRRLEKATKLAEDLTAHLRKRRQS